MKPQHEHLWKIERDSYYADLFAEFGLNYIERAGFLFDTAKNNIDVKDTTNILCSHVPKLDSVIDPVVLITSGAFCPFHDGHLSMMIHAKEAVEAIGKTVVAGYISPSHDEYVLNKVIDSYDIYERIAKIEDKIKYYPWLFIEPWEGIFGKVAVNFTDVMDRLEAYIKRHTGKTIPVYFVCGGDNARFALTFKNKGHCIVVNRPSFDSSLIRSEVGGNHRILWANGNNKESSTNIRSKGMNFIETKDVYIRQENAHPLEDELVDLMRPHFKKVECVSCNNQKNEFEHFWGDSGKRSIPIVSLDALISGDISLRVSRLFNLFGTRKLGYVCRDPDKKIIASECYVFDDDICSGGTIQYASDYLEKMGIKVKGVFSFKVSSNVEILDCRDFLLGHPDGGLVIQLPNGKLSRVPYIYPFVCPYMRASIKSAKAFSIDVWKLNKKYFLKNKLRVIDMNSIKEALCCSGFMPETDMVVVCDYFINLLSEI